MRTATMWLTAMLLFTGAACAHSGPQTSPTHEAAVLPDEVQDFIERREGCDHFRGEEPYDDARAAFLEQELERLCRGTDAELAELKRRYADAPEVLDTLNRFDVRVE